MAGLSEPSATSSEPAVASLTVGLTVAVEDGRLLLQPDTRTDEIINAAERAVGTSDLAICLFTFNTSVFNFNSRYLQGTMASNPPLRLT